MQRAYQRIVQEDALRKCNPENQVLSGGALLPTGQIRCRPNGGGLEGIGEGAQQQGRVDWVLVREGH